MQPLDFSFLCTPHSRLSRWWLLLGVISLAVAGLFSIILVVARTPALSTIPFFVNLFHAAIVVHVDMSMLAWFLCIACLMWSLLPARKNFLPLEEGALISMALGILCITLSPFDPKGEPLMSNYIPVITSPIFFMGLGLLFCSVLLMILRVVLVTPIKTGILMAVYSSVVIAFISLVAFVASFRLVPPIIDGQQYFEMLFWGGGHVLQFLHVQILLVVWLFLTYLLTGKNKPVFILLLITPLATLLTPIGYLHDVTSMEHRQFFTHLMIVGNGIAPMIVALLIIPSIWRARGERKGENRALWSSLVASLLLFLTGGAMGLMIEGQNVVIPAHYHGSIIGITLAFMGLAYALLPAFGYRKVTAWKLSYWQPIVYCIGQLMHISGLAISGGYGVLRKTPGGLTDAPIHIKAALGFMGMGGLLAAIGGLMFVVVMVRAVFYRN